MVFSFRAWSAERPTNTNILFLIVTYKCRICRVLLTSIIAHSYFIRACLDTRVHGRENPSRSFSLVLRKEKEDGQLSYWMTKQYAVFSNISLFSFQEDQWSVSELYSSKKLDSTCDLSCLIVMFVFLTWVPTSFVLLGKEFCGPLFSNRRDASIGFVFQFKFWERKS